MSPVRPPIPTHVHLSNGATVSLGEAAETYAMLLELARGDADARSELRHLRDACLDRPLAPDAIEMLVAERHLESDGAIDPVLRHVVLASVHGTEAGLAVHSPFTDGWAETLADLIRCRSRLLADLPREEAERLLRDGPRPRHERPGESVSEWGGRPDRGAGDVGDSNGRG